MSRRLILALLLWFSLAAVTTGQITMRDESDIRAVIMDLVTDVRNGTTPANHLSPNIGAEERDRQLKPFTDKFLTFDVFPDFTEMTSQDPAHAQAPARVSWTRQNSSASLAAQIKFERVEGKWYFQDFDFVLFPWALAITLLSAGFLGGMLIWGYWVHGHKQTWRDTQTRLLWTALNFTPAGWILYPLLKPWKSSRTPQAT